MQTLLLLPLFGVLIAGFAYLKLRQHHRYIYLHSIQARLLESGNGELAFNRYENHELPRFDEALITLSDFLPASTLTALRDCAARYTNSERSHLPGHKKGGTIAYQELHLSATEIVAFYQSSYLRSLISDIVGEPVIPTPINDQSSCSLLIYDRPRDHISWHYDHNFYNGRHFTVLLSLINENSRRDGPSSAQLIARKHGVDTLVPTPSNTIVLFEGARVLHKVSRLGNQERRVILSMTFSTDPGASFFKGCARRIKDTAYFGVRALWT